MKKKALLRKFGSVENIKNASVKELSEISGITEVFAKRILEELNNL